MNFIPAVKTFSPKEGCVRITGFPHFYCSGLNDFSLRQVNRHFPSLSVRLKKKGFFAEISRNGKELEQQDAGDGFDAYVIQVSERGIRIDASTESGLFYGLQTLFQMPESIPCGTIRDHASIRYRMIHWDLKGYQPRFEIMLEELEILASYKVNALLLEIEDKYDYHCAPGVGCRGAFTFQEMREISRRAAELHIMIVPKLQSIAHADYLLKHERYRNLRENGHCYQYCTSSTQVDRLWNAMADELMECFAEHSQYFHIGADEAMYLGECPKCRKLGKAGSYIRRVSRSIDHIISKGRTPVMWDDILRNAHNEMTDEQARTCRELGKKSILMYWAYGYGGKGNVFPFLRSYLDAGMRIWGASGYAGCDNWAGSLPPLEYRGINSDAWIKSAVENRLECVCATGWTRIASADCPAEPHESSWFTILYAAAGMWSGVSCDLIKFIYDLSLRFYGEVPDQPLVDAIFNIGKHPYSLTRIQDRTWNNPRFAFLHLAAAAESLTEVRNMFCNWNQYYFGRLGKALEDYRVSYMERWPVFHANRVADLKKRLEPVLRKFYGDFTADDFMNSRFGFLEKLIADTMKLTRKTKRI